MVEKFKSDRDPDGLNVSVLDCEKEEPGKVLEQLLAIPFLAEKRMVVLENLLVSKQPELQQDLLDRIEEKSLQDTNVLVFWEGTDKFRSKLAKKLFDRLDKEKFSQKFEELVGVKLSAWISQEIKDREADISRHALEYLAQNVGADIWRLSSLLDQLVCYKPKGEIQTSDIQLFLGERADNNIFNLVDAIVAGDTKKVFKMIQEQYRQGKDAQYVFAMILRQFRILLELRDVFDREDNVSSNVLAKRLGLHPFVVKKSLPFVKKYSLENLQKVYTQLLDLDIKTKTGQSDQSMLLDIFVGSLAVT